MNEQDPFPPPPLNYGAPPPPTGEGMAIASMVLGICSVVFWLCPLAGLAVAVIGLILGIQSNRRVRRATATAGIVLSSIGLLLSVANAGYGAYLGATGKHPMVNMLQQRFGTSAPATGTSSS